MPTTEDGLELPPDEPGLTAAEASHIGSLVSDGQQSGDSQYQYGQPHPDYDPGPGVDDSYRTQGNGQPVDDSGFGDDGMSAEQRESLQQSREALQQPGGGAQGGEGSVEEIGNLLGMSPEDAKTYQSPDKLISEAGRYVDQILSQPVPQPQNGFVANQQVPQQQYQQQPVDQGQASQQVQYGGFGKQFEPLDPKQFSGLGDEVTDLVSKLNDHYGAQFNALVQHLDGELGGTYRLAQQFYGLQNQMGGFQQHLEAQRAQAASDEFNRTLSKVSEQAFGSDVKQDAKQVQKRQMVGQMATQLVQRGMPVVEATRYAAARLFGDELMSAKTRRRNGAIRKQASSGRRSPPPTARKPMGGNAPTDQIDPNDLDDDSIAAMIASSEQMMRAETRGMR